MAASILMEREGGKDTTVVVFWGLAT